MQARVLCQPPCLYPQQLFFGCAPVPLAPPVLNVPLLLSPCRRAGVRRHACCGPGGRGSSGRGRSRGPPCQQGLDGPRASPDRRLLHAGARVPLQQGAVPRAHPHHASPHPVCCAVRAKHSGPPWIRGEAGGACGPAPSADVAPHLRSTTLQLTRPLPRRPALAPPQDTAHPSSRQAALALSRTRGGSRALLRPGAGCAAHIGLPSSIVPLMILASRLRAAPLPLDLCPILHSPPPVALQSLPAACSPLTPGPATAQDILQSDVQCLRLRSQGAAGFEH